MGPLLLVKVSLFLSMTLFAARLLSRAPATTRHGLWSVVFGSLLLLAPLAASLPALRVPVPAGWQSGAAHFPYAPAAIAQPMVSATVAIPNPIEASASVETVETVRRSTGTADWPGLATVFSTAWLIGMLAAALTVLLSLLRVRGLVRTAEPLCDRDWQHAVTTICSQLGIRNPVRLLVSPRVGTPMAGGVFCPAIFLPRSASSWSAEHRDLVLAHELAHLARRDPIRHLMTRFALACYWFHPLAWLAAREAAIAREQACDETVLAMGARPSAYARVLLDLAESMSVRRRVRFLGALPMVHRSHLEKRLMAILNVDVRPGTRRLLLGPAIGVALLTLSVAAAQPALSEVEGPALSEVEGPVLSEVEGPFGQLQIPISASDAARFAEEQARPFAQAYARPFAETDARPIAGTDARPFAETYARPFAETYARPVAEALAKSFAGVVGDSSIGVVSGTAGFALADAPAALFQSSACLSEPGSSNVIGSRDGDRIIQRSFGDLKVCMLAEGVGDRGNGERPSQWIGRARRIVLEAQRAGTVQRLEVAGSRTSWQVNGATRAFDTAAEAWRDRMLAVLDITWEVSSLRGEESALRGQISAIHGERSALLGEISALQGSVSAMQGRISAVQGEESRLRGEISAIRGHVSTLQGKISAEQGKIMSLRTVNRYAGLQPNPDLMRSGVESFDDSRERNRIATEIADHQAALARIQREIRDYGAERRIAAVQKQIDAIDATAKVMTIEREIRDFDLNGKVAAVERRIAGLNVDGKVRDIERQIERLDAERRARQLEDRLDAELPRLTAAISAIR